MARKSQILRLITVIAFMGLFIIILMNIFNNGQSYYYINVERKLQMQQRNNLPTNIQKIWPKLHFSENATTAKSVTDNYDIRPILQQLQKKLSNLPILYYFRHSALDMEKSKNCAQYSDLRTLDFYNTFWQTFSTKELIFRLYGAYYDDRPETGPIIRILTMINYQGETFPTIYCQLWFEDESKPIITTISEYKIIWSKEWVVKTKVYFPYLLTCKLPKHMDITGDPIPKAINLVENECDMATNSLRIIYNKPEYPEEKQQFAVCVKGLDFPYEDLSSRLVEWLELLKILGVHKVYMYELQVHANISKVLDYYRDNGFVEVQNITFVGGVVGVPELEHWLIKYFRLNKILNELIPYNDCFFRNMYRYEYIALLDIDEIIMPQDNLTTWQDLVTFVKPQEINKNCIQGFASLCATNSFYPAKYIQHSLPSNTYPPYMHMLNHGYRLAEFSPPQLRVKCLHNTENVITLHNHYPLSYFDLYCPAYDMPTESVQLQHYRDIDASHTDVPDFIWDNNVERFKEPLIQRCTNVLKYLKLIS